jgi:hypothetical protein
LLRSLENGSDIEKYVRNRILTTNVGGSAAAVADLYLMLRVFDNKAVREYLGRFFPSSDESSVEQELSADLEGGGSGYVSDGVLSPAPSHSAASRAAPAALSTKASKIWMSLEKNKLLARDMVHLPLNLELVCASYQADPNFHLLPEHTLADLYGRLYLWILSGSGAPEQMAPLEKHLQKGDSQSRQLDLGSLKQFVQSFV